MGLVVVKVALRLPDDMKAVMILLEQLVGSLGRSCRYIIEVEDTSLIPGQRYYFRCHECERVVDKSDYS